MQHTNCEAGTSDVADVDTLQAITKVVHRYANAWQISIRATKICRTNKKQLVERYRFGARA